MKFVVIPRDDADALVVTIEADIATVNGLLEAYDLSGLDLVRDNMQRVLTVLQDAKKTEAPMEQTVVPARAFVDESHPLEMWPRAQLVAKAQALGAEPEQTLGKNVKALRELVSNLLTASSAEAQPEEEPAPAVPVRPAGSPPGRVVRPVFRLPRKL